MLLRFLQLIADGAPVTNAGLAVGYQSAGAFVAAFRRVFGVAPGKYLGKERGNDVIPSKAKDP